MEDLQAKLMEEKYRRGILAKMRFKAIVRHVIYNLPWLAADEEFDIDDIKRNITMSKRGKNMSDDLTIIEKILFRKPRACRTDEEKKHLHKIIMRIPCFRQYTEDIQYKLAETLYFEYYEGEKTIFKQGDKAHRIYFLISGEIAVSQQVWNEENNAWITVPLGIKKGTDMFGERALMHNEERKVTVVTLTPLEVLQLNKEDFNYALLDSLKKEWDAIQNGLSLFSYFKDWSAETLQECCLAAKIKIFEENEIIFGGKTIFLTDMIYFIIEGQCSIIEHLKVVETVQDGIKKYSLYNPKKYHTHALLHTGNTQHQQENNEKVTSTTNAILKQKIKNGNKDEGLPVESTSKSKLEKFDNLLKQYKGHEKSSEDDSKPPNIESNLEIEDLEHLDLSEEVNTNEDERNKEKLKLETEEHSEKFKNNNKDEQVSLTKTPSFLNKYSLAKTITPNMPQVKNYFLQICILRKLATFRIASYLLNRRVLALTRVKCLLLPAYWLDQHKKAEIWERIDLYLTQHIPTKQTVFKEFIKHKKWLKYSEQRRNELIERRRIPVDTTIRGVPYSLRIKEIRH